MPDPSNIPDLSSLASDSGSFSWAAFIIGSLFGMIGVGYFMYGKRQSEFWFMICGICLNVYYWLVSGTLMVTVVGIALTAAPFLINRYYGE